MFPDYFFPWDVKDWTQICSSSASCIIPEAWLNVLGSDVVNMMRDESSIPSHSFQEDLLISIKESLQGNWQTEFNQSLSVRDVHITTLDYLGSIFSIKFKTVSTQCRRQKITRGHWESFNEFVLITLSHQSSDINIFSYVSTWDENWNEHGFRASLRSLRTLSGVTNSTVIRSIPRHSPCREKEWDEMSFKK